MRTAAEARLITALAQAHLMERQSLRLLETGRRLADDSLIASIYAAHLRETEDHERAIAERLGAHGEPDRSGDRDREERGAMLQLPDTPIQLAESAFAFECREVAAYHFLAGLARYADDAPTAEVAKRIMAQEEGAALAVSATFDRTLALVAGEPVELGTSAG